MGSRIIIICMALNDMPNVSFKEDDLTQKHQIRADTGFRRVKPTEYEPRLFHFHGIRKKISVKQVPLSKKSLDSSDVFILDLGLTLYQVTNVCHVTICYCVRLYKIIFKVVSKC